MILTEKEAKALLAQADLQLPSPDPLTFHVIVKAQVLHGNRAQLGLIKKANSPEELNAARTELLASQDLFGQPISEVLVEEAIPFDREIYLALTYDTHSRQLVARYSVDGGVGMDDRGNSVQTIPLSITDMPQAFPPEKELLSIVQKLWQVLSNNDATLVEINPLVRVANSSAYICLDAKIELEDQAQFRHPEWQQYGTRSALGRDPTEREKKAHQVSHQDHRGVAGDSFFEFPGGTIGVMASGGGASTLAMDALLVEGLKPANYTEYSGNPTREKVAALGEVVLSIPNLKALYVVGSNANFTDIYETLAGVIDSLLASSYAQQDGFCLLVRRGGPRWQEAFTMIEERLTNTSIKYKLLGPEFPLVQTAHELRLLIESAKDTSSDGETT